MAKIKQTKVFKGVSKWAICLTENCGNYLNLMIISFFKEVFDIAAK